MSLFNINVYWVLCTHSPLPRIFLFLISLISTEITFFNLKTSLSIFLSMHLSVGLVVIFFQYSIVFWLVSFLLKIQLLIFFDPLWEDIKFKKFLIIFGLYQLDNDVHCCAFNAWDSEQLESLAWNLNKFSSMWSSNFAFLYFVSFLLLLPITYLLHLFTFTVLHMPIVLFSVLYFSLSTCFSLDDFKWPTFKVTNFFLWSFVFIIPIYWFNNCKYRYFQFQNYHLFFNISYFGWNSLSYNMIYIFLKSMLLLEYLTQI